jgi:hypothetical protein
MQTGAVAGKATEDDTGQRRRRRERLYGRRNGNSGSAISRKSERTSGNRGKRDRGKAVVAAQFDGAAVARSKLRVLVARTTVPDGADSMDYMPRGKQITFGDFGAAGLAAMERAAFGQQFGPGRAMDRTIDAAAAEQRRVGGVDDGVNAQRRDIGDNDFQPRRADLADGQTQAVAAALTMTPLSARSCCNSPA